MMGPAQIAAIEPVDTDAARLGRLRTAVNAAACLHEAEIHRGGYRWYPVMVTLTYADIGVASPRDITEFHKRVRQHLKRRGIRYRFVWVGELQQRGALHYHVIIWMPWGERLPKPDRQGGWTHGSTNIKAARCGVRYICKYATKLRSKLGSLQHTYPAHFRMHGAGGLDECSREERAHVLLPSWIRLVTQPGERLRRCTGGFFATATGEFYRAIYAVDRIVRRPGGGALIHLRSLYPGAHYPCPSL